MFWALCLSLLLRTETAYLNAGKQSSSIAVAHILHGNIEVLRSSHRGRENVPIVLEEVSRGPAKTFLQSSISNVSGAAREGNQSSVSDIPVFDFSCKVLNDPSKPLGSVILLTPLGGYAGWWRWWLEEDFKNLMRKRYRVIEAMPRRKSDYVHPMWYTYKDSEDGSGWFNEIPIESELTIAVEYVHSLIQKERDLGIPYSKITTIGYSQGATLALEAGFRFPKRLGLVLAERGIVLASRVKDTQSVMPTPYIMTAGEKDDKYGAWHVKEGHGWLCTKGIPSFYKEIAGLDHGDQSVEETRLALESIRIVLEGGDSTPASVRSSLKAIPNWTASCI